ncbi:MAG: FAD-dependent oxidoreductase [Marinibacterium sp.]
MKQSRIPPNRREILMGATAGVTALTAPGLLRAATPMHVVVVGGGFSGSTAAKYLRMWGSSALKVTLVDPSKSHVSCVMSNLVLNGNLKLRNLRFSHSGVAAYGVDVVRDKVVSVDPATNSVMLKNGGKLGYDKLVLTGGIGFKKIPGWDTKTAPHAWVAGGQTLQLRRMIAGMPSGGTFVQTVPKSPYRCPPGPYERACVVADILKSRGGGKVILLDANPGITAESGTFSRAFSQLYGNIIEYHTDASIDSVAPDGSEIVTSVGTFQGDVLNVLGTHRAASVVRKSGAVPSGSDFAPVDPLSYASTVSGMGDVHIIGDSQGTGQPKSGHMANAQAKVCADAIVRTLAGDPIDTIERKDAITTNSACFSPITKNAASWLTAVFRYDTATGQMALVQESLGEAGKWTRGNYRDMFDWANNLWADTFK